jgi:uncharacterized protein YecT (DUF1311 family)
MQHVALFALLLLDTGDPKFDRMMAESLKDCDRNQTAMNFCARHAFDVADAELNKLYKQALLAMKTHDAAERLRKAQRAWVQFRDAHCHVMVGPPQGSMHGQLWHRCLEELTKTRAEELRVIAYCEEGPCPPTE